MDIKITTLSENTADTPDLIAEWGLSILMDIDGYRILFDTGASFSAIYNAQMLGIDLSTIDKMVLSHGHFDHAGGLLNVLQRINKPIEIIAHPDIWDAKYALRADHRYIGIAFNREQLEALGATFYLTKDPVWIKDNIVTTGEIPMINDYEQIDPDLYIKQNNEFKHDPLADDLAMAIKTEQGLVIILGCSHRGMINTINHLQQITGETRVYCVIGGTHLMAASPERLAKTTADLRQIAVQRLGVSHCTGFQASSWLAQEFPDIFFLNNTGTQLNLP